MDQGGRGGISALPGEAKGALARTSEVSGPGAPRPGGRGSGSRKGENVDKESGSMAQREPRQAQHEASQGRTGRAHPGRVLTDRDLRQSEGWGGWGIWRNNRK